jgi:hypothetical protein
MNSHIFKLVALIALLAGGFSYCAEKEEGEEIPFTRIGKGSCLYGKFEDGRVFLKQNRIFCFQDEWERFIIQIGDNNKNETDSFSEIEIDFDNYQVVGVIDDFHRSGSYIFEIKSIIDYSNRIVVTVLAKNNSKGGASPQVESQPYHIVKMPKSTKRIEFKYINK